MIFRCYPRRFLHIIISLITLIIIIHHYISPKTPVSKVCIIPSYGDQTNFRQELFNERLISYNLQYPDSFTICNKTGKPLNDRKNLSMHKVFELLQRYQKRMIPYPIDYFNGRGIVLTTGSKQLKFARVNLKMLELSGTKLPVQIWYSSSQISRDFMLKLLQFVSKLHASICCFVTNECRTLHKVWQINSTYIYRPRESELQKVFPYKPAAIISSTFAEVLFLDCDAYVTRDPEPLFLSDPMYLRFGALFYPDAMKSRQHPIVWNLFNTSCAENEYEFDSAMILVDKRRVWDGLYLTKLMNDDHRLFYRVDYFHFFHVSDGDKDTFRLAFRYLRMKYYLVMIPCATGSFNGSHFCGHTLCKTDSLSQHIYVNHAHLFKYDKIEYSFENLAYTRIGLGDPNNNSFQFHICSLGNENINCFHIFHKQNEPIPQRQCYTDLISFNKIEDRSCMFNESLMIDKSQNNRILMSKTNDLMPNFVNNFLQLAKAEL